MTNKIYKARPGSSFLYFEFVPELNNSMLGHLKSGSVLVTHKSQTDFEALPVRLRGQFFAKPAFTIKLTDQEVYSDYARTTDMTGESVTLAARKSSSFSKFLVMPRKQRACITGYLKTGRQLNVYTSAERVAKFILASASDKDKVFAEQVSAYLAYG